MNQAEREVLGAEIGVLIHDRPRLFTVTDLICFFFHDVTGSRRFRFIRLGNATTGLRAKRTNQKERRRSQVVLWTPWPAECSSLAG
jgi:hypothetical protein